jgi:hypothetical protein
MWMGFNGAVHARLREAGLVTFVMTVPAIAPHVDHHVTLKGLSILHGQNGHAHDRFHIVAVDVEDRGLD